MLKKILLIIFLSLIGCANLPESPEVVQYGIYPDVNPPGLYGVNSKTQSKSYKSFNDISIKGAQCLMKNDYKAMQRWISELEKIAAKRCK